MIEDDLAMAVVIAKVDQQFAAARSSLHDLVGVVVKLLDDYDGDPLKVMLAATPRLERKPTKNLAGTLMLALLELAEARRVARG